MIIFSKGYKRNFLEILKKIKKYQETSKIIIHYEKSGGGDIRKYKGKSEKSGKSENIQDILVNI